MYIRENSLATRRKRKSMAKKNNLGLHIIRGDEIQATMVMKRRMAMALMSMAEASSISTMCQAPL